MQVSAASLRMVLLFMIAFAAACAVRNPALDQARDVYDKARQDPAIVRNVGMALKLSILPTSI